MFERIKSIFSGGVLSKYESTGNSKQMQLYSICTGRCRKTLRPVSIKKYSREGVEVERKLDSLYRVRPLAEMLPELKHPLIAVTIEAEVTDTTRIEILESFTGASLREVMDRSENTPEEFIDCIVKAGSGLSYLHSLGLLHRGLTVDAITTGQQGTKIIDLSFLMNAQKTTAGSTMTGATSYSAPEVLRRSPLDVRSDIFSLGAILYEGVCGESIFPSVSGFERLLRVMNSKPEPPTAKNHLVSEELSAVIMKAVANNRAHRYATVEEFLAALKAAPVPGKLPAHAHAFAG